jgi:pentatricopeptide repeat protein
LSQFYGKEEDEEARDGGAAAALPLRNPFDLETAQIGARLEVLLLQPQETREESEEPGCSAAEGGHSLTVEEEGLSNSPSSSSLSSGVPHGEEIEEERLKKRLGGSTEEINGEERGGGEEESNEEGRRGGHQEENPRAEDGSSSRDFFVSSATDFINASTSSSSSPSSSSSRVVRKERYPRGTLFTAIQAQLPTQMDHLINLDEILSALKQTTSAEGLHEVMANWKGKLSFRLMMSLLKEERDWQRSLALHDWMLEEGGYRASTFGYNIVIRNVLKNRRWTLGEGLVSEMIEKKVAPDKFTYSTLISSFGKAGKFDSALMWLHRMEEKGITPDLVTFSTVIVLAGKLKNFTRAVSLFSKMRAAGKTLNRKTL